MKRSGALFLLLSVVSLAISGCDVDNTKDAVKAISQGLKVPVLVNAPDSDTCASQQIISLANEFNKLSDFDRNQLTARIQLAKLTGIVLDPSNVTSVISGNKLLLNNYQEDCEQVYDGQTCYDDGNGGQNCTDNYRTECTTTVDVTKTVQDDTQTTGKAPGLTKTKLADSVLTVTTQAQQDNSVVQTYQVGDDGLYAQIKTAADLNNAARANPNSVVLANTSVPTANCGNALTLDDIRKLFPVN